MGAVERYCDRAMLLEQGEVVMLGDPRRVAHRVHRAELRPRRRPGRPRPAARAATPATGAAARSLDAWFEDEHGEPHRHARAGPRRARSRPSCSFARARRGSGARGSRSTTERARRRVRDLHRAGRTSARASFAAGERVELSASPSTTVFAPGRYYATPCVAHRGGGARRDRPREEHRDVVVVTGDARRRRRGRPAARPAPCRARAQAPGGRGP